MDIHGKKTENIFTTLYVFKKEYKRNLWVFGDMMDRQTDTSAPCAIYDIKVHISITGIDDEHLRIEVDIVIDLSSC